MRIPFAEFIKNNVPLFDGSMGALLSALGYKGHNIDLMNVDEGDVIYGVHKSYVDAGANVVITNTLGATTIKLAKAGLADRCEEIVTAAVKNARKAVGEDGYVALDVGATGEFMEPVGTLTMEEMVESFRILCRAGKAAGADFALLETQTDIAECRAACIAAREEGLPAAASFTFEKNGHTLTGGSPDCCALTLQAAGAIAMGVNCSGGPLDMIAPLQEMRRVCPLPVIVQPNAGLPIADAEGNARYPFTPEMMTPQMLKILESGAAAIGGCCGTTPEHIRQMAPLAAAHAPAESGWDGAERICSARLSATLEEAKAGLATVDDIEDLYDLEDEDTCALIDLTGMDAEEARETVFEAQSMSKKPLAFKADSEEALEAALRIYAGVAAVVDSPFEDVIARYGAKKL